MIYTPMTIKASKLAYKMHHGQTDRAGVPYIFHPLHLAEQMETEETTIVALLHDVIEDTSLTIDHLAKLGFSKQVIEAIGLLSKSDDTPYFEYINSLKFNEIARVVKIADLKHNMDLTRLKKVTDNDLSRHEKYRIALQILGGDLGD